jgi:16S rRNA (adenine1518-N6/adenine1519-N6)-dimethyltransferase
MAKIGTINKTKSTLDKHDFYIKKKYGQNFLVDQNILRKIVEVPSITDETLVIEIGPGLGSLTEYLLEKSKHVLAYEIDKDLLPILSETFKTDKLTVYNRDFLKCDIDLDIKELGITYDQVVVVANLPFYITTPIILKIIEESSLIKEMVLMTQQEVAERLTSKPSTKDYNSLSIAIQYKTKAEIALKVPRTVFIPAPNVDSAVVKLSVIDEIAIKPNNEALFYEIVRSSFAQRRKTLVNNIHNKYNLKKEIIINLLIELDLDPRIRAENLSVNDFIRLSDILYKTL